MSSISKHILLSTVLPKLRSKQHTYYGYIFWRDRSGWKKKKKNSIRDIRNSWWLASCLPTTITKSSARTLGYNFCSDYDYNTRRVERICREWLPLECLPQCWSGHFEMKKSECESGLFKTYDVSVFCHNSKVLPVSKSLKLLLTYGAYTLTVTRAV